MFIRVFVAIIIGICLLSHPPMYEAQGNCKLERQSQLRIGDFATFSEYDTMPDGLYMNATIDDNGQNVSRGDLPVKIIDGSICQNNNLWWKVETASGSQGWMLELSGSTIGLAPLRYNDEPFITTVDLDIPPTIVNQFMQIGFDGSGGGGDSANCIKPWYRGLFHFYQTGVVRSNIWFDVNEVVTVTITDPDDNLYEKYRRQDRYCFETDFLVTQALSFDIDAPVGTWHATFEGTTKTDTVEFLVLPRSLPWVKFTGDDLLLDGFDPHEQVQVILTEKTGKDSSPSTTPMGIIYTWDVNVDQSGQLIAKIDPNITRSCLRYFAVRDSYGQLWSENVAKNSALGPNLFGEGLDTQLGECSYGLTGEIQTIPLIDEVNGPKADFVRYYLQLEGGTNIEVKVERLSSVGADPSFSLLDADETVIAMNDDTQDQSQVNYPDDAYLPSIVIPRDDTYILEINAVSEGVLIAKLTINKTLQSAETIQDESSSSQLNNGDLVLLKSSTDSEIWMRATPNSDEANYDPVSSNTLAKSMNVEPVYDSVQWWYQVQLLNTSTRGWVEENRIINLQASINKNKSTKVDCDGAYGPTLSTNENVLIPNGAGDRKIWAEPNNVPQVGLLIEGDVATVIGGPICKAGQRANVVTWEIRTSSGITGWISEGYSDAIIPAVIPIQR